MSEKPSKKLLLTRDEFPAGLLGDNLWKMYKDRDLDDIIECITELIEELTELMTMIESEEP